VHHRDVTSFTTAANVGRTRHGDQQLAELAVGYPRRQLRGMVSLRENHPSFVDEHCAGLGQLHLPFGSLKQCYAQLFLELPNLLAERRFADMQALGGLAEVQTLCDGDDIPQVPEFH
jgi:hypothetical protein